MRAKTVWGLTCEKPLQFFSLRKAILWLPKAFQNLCNFFPAEGYPLPTQGLSKTSTKKFPAEGYPLVTEGVFKSSTILFPAEGYPLVTEGVSKTGFYSWVIWAIYWSFLPDIVSHTHTHTHIASAEVVDCSGGLHHAVHGQHAVHSKR